MPYLPSKPPPTSSDDGTALAFYLEDELSRLAMSLLDDVQAVEVRSAHSAPLRPREGMLVYADGTDWNPGSGEGLYTFGSDTAWHPVGNVSKNYLGGLTLSTTGGSGTFGITAGAAADSTNVNILTLASAYTKTTAAWAVGTGNGALDTGAVANNTWYHVHLIKRVDTNIVDILLSTSPSAPTMPTGYTLFRRIGSMRTDGSAHWLLFHQLGDEFLWDVIGAVNVTNPGTASTLRTISTPFGVQTLANLAIVSQVVGTVDGRGWVVSPDITDPGAVTSANLTFGGIDTTAGVGASDWICQALVRTDTSAQVRTRHIASDANTFFALNTLGWFDTRGKT